MIWKTSITVQEINERSKNSLSDHLGITFTEIGKDFLKASMPVISKTMQPMGILHGGATCALAETVGSAAGNFTVDLSKELCVGLEINVNHMRMVEKGYIHSIARPFHLGKTTQVWEIKIYDDEEKLIAISRLTLMVIQKKRP